MSLRRIRWQTFFMAIDRQIIAELSSILNKHLYKYKVTQNSWHTKQFDSQWFNRRQPNFYCFRQTFKWPELLQSFSVSCILFLSPFFYWSSALGYLRLSGHKVHFSLTHIQFVFTFGLSYRYFLGNFIFKFEEFFIRSENQLYPRIFTEEMLKFGRLGRKLCKPETLSRVCISFFLWNTFYKIEIK